MQDILKPMSIFTRSLALSSLLMAPVAALAIPVTEASVHFFTPHTALAGSTYQGVSTSNAANLNQSSSAQVPSGPGNAEINAQARVELNQQGQYELGISLDTNRGGGVAATLFEGVTFLTPTTPTTANTLQSYSIAALGTLTGSIAQTPVFSSTPIPAGDPLPGPSGVTLSAFTTLDARDDAVQGNTSSRVTTLSHVGVAGPFTRTFVATPPTPPVQPSQVFSDIIYVAGPETGACFGVEVCQFGVELGLGPDLSQYSYTSFGLGLAMTGMLIDEIAAFGQINAFNSFHLDGLALLDADGNVVPGFFMTDSGVNLTVAQFAPSLPPTGAVPLPAGLMLLMSGLMAVGALRLGRAAGRATGGRCNTA
jgi:hypothetical protein